CPLGSGALAGSSLPLDRAAACAALGFDAPSRNALDAIGNRDCALDLAHGFVRVLVDASRICEEIVAWCAPAYGFVALSDAAATGSSLMPQKRNPDPFELVRARAAASVGAYAGALATLCGLATSYQRDLQETKAVTIGIAETALAALEAFARAWDCASFVRDRTNGSAGTGYTIATDWADALVAAGTPSRAAHALVGGAVARAEAQGRELRRSDLDALAAAAGVAALEAPLDAAASVQAKQTIGSTAPVQVARQLDALESELAALDVRP
ncbi:MAG TPA: lyase family protein, partial [Candidatus Tumulicola sp.]|nr:lyase family protein [Candidatus Tumulicola sp.]